MGRVLLAGESWTSYGVHVKGFSSYYTGEYEEGAAPLIEALEAGGYEVTFLRNHEASRGFPADPEELARYHVVVFSDIGADTLLLHPDVLKRSQRRPNPLVAVSEYVHQGGGFLMIGGYMSFSGYHGHARYHLTPLADILPVRLLGADDRIERPEGCIPEVVEGDHEIVRGFPRQWPAFLGYNKLLPKAGCRVLVEVEGDPILAICEVGRGRVAAFASDCAPHWAPPEVLSWTYYPMLWQRLIGWLAGERRS